MPWKSGRWRACWWAIASGKPEFKEVVTEALGALKVPPAALFSTLGRTAARGLETQLCVHWLMDEYDKLIANLKAGDTATADTTRWEPSTWPAETKGYGFTEAPRGALCHWIHIKDAKIANYQIVVPSTWNASPKDGKGQHGAYEAALLDTPMADPKRPVEILRTIHSFDPCLACASHVFGPEWRKAGGSQGALVESKRSGGTMATSVHEFDPRDMAAHPEQYFRRAVRLAIARAHHPLGQRRLPDACCFLTGLYIAHPMLAPNGEAYRNFVMGRVRQIHFARRHDLHGQLPAAHLLVLGGQ